MRNDCKDYLDLVEVYVHDGREDVLDVGYRCRLETGHPGPHAFSGITGRGNHQAFTIVWTDLGYD